MQFVLLALNEPIRRRRGTRNRGVRLLFVLVLVVVVRCDSVAQDGVQVGLNLVIVFVFVFRCPVARWTGAFFILVIVFLFVGLNVRLDTVRLDTVRLDTVINSLTVGELLIEFVFVHHFVVWSIALQIVVSGTVFVGIAHQGL